MGLTILSNRTLPQPTWFWTVLYDRSQRTTYGLYSFSFPFFCVDLELAYRFVQITKPQMTPRVILSDLSTVYMIHHPVQPFETCRLIQTLFNNCVSRDSLWLKRMHPLTILRS